MSDIPSRGPASAGTLLSPLGLGVNPGRLAGEEKRRRSCMGETLHGYHEKLAEKAGIGSYLAKQGKTVISACLPCSLGMWGGLRGAGAPCPLLRVPGRWAACEPDCGALVPVLVEGNEPVAHENCEIQPCAGPGCA